MAKCRKALALLLTVLMVFSLLPMTIAAEDPAESTQPVWPAEGSIKLDKDAAAVGDNLWEVTLGIQGKNYKTTSDVVLVIDCSGSMGEGTKLENTRTAAKAFGDKLLTNDSSTRIAIVTYIDEATAYNEGHFYGADELEAFKTAVDDATYAKGGTNQQAGIHKAQELLTSTASTGKLKNIVILSDGEPTYCYEVTELEGNLEFESKFYEKSNCSFGRHNTPTIEFRAGNLISAPIIKSANYNTIIGEGDEIALSYSEQYSIAVSGYFNHPERTGSFKCSHTFSSGKTWNYSIPANNSNGTTDTIVSLSGHESKTTTFSTKVSSIDVVDCGQSTIWEANTAKAAGTTIFSVALQAGTDGENTLKACATDAAKGYYAIGSKDNVEEKLTKAFKAIAGSIAIAAKNGAVVDPMGDKVQLSFSGSAPVITNKLDEYTSGNADVYYSQGAVTYDNDTRTINWTVGNVSEGDNPIMKYKVTVKDGYNPSTGEVLDANGRTTFTYINYKDEETTGEFPIPKVTVGGGNILVHYYMVNAKGEPINENGVVV
ncbi:MAG: VWA domain-containing protein, partial [Clostridiales bacterium]|nr:VWA domain-containing protein [Clostridiales bacterium]